MFVFCWFKNCWLISLILPFFFADFSILYIQSFVYTVYDELAGQRKGPGPSGKSTACCHSHIATTETDTGEPPRPHEHVETYKKHTSLSIRNCETKHQCAHNYPCQQNHSAYIMAGDLLGQYWKGFSLLFIYLLLAYILIVTIGGTINTSLTVSFKTEHYYIIV